MTDTDDDPRPSWAVMAPGMGDAEGLRTDWTTEPGPKETP